MILAQVNGEVAVSHQEFRNASALALLSRLYGLEGSGPGPLQSAQHNWTYLEPKLLLQAQAGPLSSDLTFTELARRLESIDKALRQSRRTP